MPQLDFKTENLATIAEFLSAVNAEKCAEEWKKSIPSEEDLNTLRDRVSKSFAFRYPTLYGLSKFLIAVLLVVGLTYAWKILTKGSMGWDFERAYWTVVKCCVVWASIEFLTEFFGRDSSTAESIMKNLTPIAKRPSLCSTAVNICKESTLAEEYRKTVLAMNRELFVHDFKVMETLARHQALKHEAEIDVRTCKALHGLG